MKKKKYNIALKFYYKFFIVMAVIISIVILTGVYLLKVSFGCNNSSANWAVWPANFTFSFAHKIQFKDGKPYVTDSGLKDLKKNNLYISILDKNGDVKFSYNQKEKTMEHYSPIDIVQIYKTGGTAENTTQFVGSTDNGGEKWTYVIGFPAKIYKVWVYFNYDNYYNLKFILIGIGAAILLIVLLYGLWMNHALSNIIGGIDKICTDDYVDVKEKGMYKDINCSLNTLNKKIKSAEEERNKDQKLREEWVANISHDLKTPLSPIRGYAEILADAEYKVDEEEVKKYGEVILRNAENIETLVENLNFTYQLKNGMIPVKMQRGNIMRLIKEVIIDILSNPKYEKRKIIFSCDEERVLFDFDKTLIRRAFTNLIVNCVIHNPHDTLINVSLETSKDSIIITIKDNGVGMSSEEVDKLFNRYYRATNSRENIKGSGLGMSIAKQIIENHYGTISVESVKNAGTTICVIFPLTKDDET